MVLVPAAFQLVEDPGAVRVALSPVRRALLELLRQPMSATEAASHLDLTRQRVNYHLTVLEGAGLIELVEVRPRRGFTERILRTVADLVVDPDLLGAASPTATGRDRFAAAHLVATAGQIVRDVSRMQAAAATRQQRLLTFTVETEIGFEQPAEIHRFTDELASALADLARRFNHPEGRPYRIVLGGHPATQAPSGGTSP
jgi:DNA-binding transcriptional ArsR family regulator